MIIPPKLRDDTRWVVWKREKKNGKYTKVPYDAKNGDFAKSNDPKTWATFEKASGVANDLGEDYNGVGFMLYGSKFVGIDFDGVIDDGVPEPYVLNIISQMGDPYCEVTPSGTGLRVFVECPELPPGNRKFSVKKKGVEKYGAEIYAGSEGGRYLTVTGQHFSGTDIPILPNLEIVHFLMSKFPDEHFRRLWMGDASEYENDESRVDLALMGILARAFSGDVAKITRFFNASVPGHREKWVNRADYRQLTINKATSGMSMTETAWKQIIDHPRKNIEFQLDPTEEEKTKWTAFDYVVQPLDGQFDGWFPLGSPSLLGGSSGSGKTTFMLDLCVKQAIRADFYGHRTNGRPYLVLMLDRGEESHARTMRRLGFVTNQVPMKLLRAVVDGEASQEVISNIEQADPRPELVFIEGIDMLVSDPNSLEVVMPFMHEMQQIATHFHIALVGSCGAPKQKAKDAYTAKRDTIFGSAVWSRMSETIVTIQYPEGDDTADQRVVSVLPRNARAEQFQTEFQEGKLAVIPPPVEEEKYSGPTKKERQEQEMREQAQRFIIEYLQEGPKNNDDVADAAKELHAINMKTLLDASTDLFHRGIIQITQEVVETAQSRATQFIIKELADGAKRGAEVYLIGMRVEGFSRKTLEEVSAELAAFGQIRKTNGKDAVWSLIENAKPMPSIKGGITKWVWSLVPINATANTMKNDDGEFKYDIS